MRTIGILALQGCVEPHRWHLEQLGVKVQLVRFPEDLEQLDGLILPGGESTTMLRLSERNGLTAPLQEFVRQRPSWGVCAGSILLAEQVSNPVQFSFKAARISAERNSYGSQLDSFKATLEVNGLSTPIETDFIRAPRLKPLHDEVEVLAKYGEDPVLLLDGHALCQSFHTELGSDFRLHELFLKRCCV